MKVTRRWDKYEREHYEIVEKFMYNIPLKEAKYPALYKSVYSKFERNYNGRFFFDKGVLY